MQDSQNSFSRTFLTLLIVGFCCLAGHSQSLMNVDVNKKISIGLPAEFVPMTDDQIADRYITTRRPIAMFTDAMRVVDLGVNQSQTDWEEKDLTILKDFYKANITGLYTQVDFLNEGLETINGRTFAYFEFESSVSDEEGSLNQRPDIQKYTYIQYAIVNGKSWVFNFTVPLRYKNQWQGTAASIMRSVKIKK